MAERTFAIIKPDATRRNLEGPILSVIQQNGLRVVAMKKMRLTREQAEGFYHVHKERPFFASLTDFMTSGPIVAMVLEGDNAVARWRELMGATNPENAADLRQTRYTVPTLPKLLHLKWATSLTPWR
jgi:nucleoside-diphosphate kinase